MRTFFLFALVTLGTYCNAQNEILTWKDHFSYRPVIHVANLGNLVVGATELGAFIHDMEDGSITRLNKTNLLSDAGISAIEPVPEYNMILIGYENGNMDVWVNGSVVNVSDVFIANVLANKTINDFYVFGDFAYISTKFSIIQFDLLKLEIKDTFVIGSNGTFLGVNDLVIQDNEILAATESGLYSASFPNAFLSDFQSWDLQTDSPETNGNFEGIEEFEGFLYTHLTQGDGDVIYRKPVNSSDAWEVWQDDPNVTIRDIEASDEYLVVTTAGIITQYNTSLDNIKEISFLGEGFPDFYQALASPDGNGLWIADKRAGLHHATNTVGIKKVIPNGPDFSDARRISSYFENVWVATGGVDLGFDNNFKRAGINGFTGNSWSSINDLNNDFMLGVNDVGGFVWDIMDVTIDPNNNNRVIASSWEEGLIEIINNEPVQIFNADNSPLVGTNNTVGDGVINIDGIQYDNEGNLWVTNSFTEDCLHVLKTDGSWKSFNFGPDINTSVVLGDILIARNDFIWVTLPKENGVLVFDYGETIDDTSDDQYRILTSVEGEGSLPSDDIYSITEDINGEIWIGTLQGMGIFYNPDCLFTENECEAQQILIEQDGNFQILLETETITALEIDGGNRKWIGTQTSGVYLLSEDGIDQIYHFTKENSPLLSNNVQDISFNFTSGEIFFATDIGIVSFIGTASGFDGIISETKVYPNPVREDYDGIITIDGLTGDTDVRITDINGNLVFSTISEGGRATWNGRNENGNRVSTGVYLVFASNPNGEETTVTKIAFVN